MIKVTINKKAYKFPEHWGEISLKQAIELSGIIETDMPNELKMYFQTMNEMKDERFEDHNKDVRKALAEMEVSWTEEHHFKIFPTFYGKVMRILSDVPQEVIDMTDPISRNVFYNNYLKQFMWGLLYHPYDFVKKGIKHFEVEGVKYFFPEDKDVLGVQRPMGNGTTAVEFSEAADLITFASELQGGKVKYLANVIAILCRPMIEGKIEAYNESVSLERAEKFKQHLTMDVCWEVFFCLDAQLNLFLQRTAIYQMREAVQNQRLHSLNQVLKDLGGMDQSLKQQSLKASR